MHLAHPPPTGVVLRRACAQHHIGIKADSWTLASQVIARHPNVCSQLHMPAQSGSSAMLVRMRRGYTREAYDALVRHVRATIPGVALSTDIIAGASLTRS